MAPNRRWSYSAIALCAMSICFFLLISFCIWLVFVYPTAPDARGSLQEERQTAQMARFTVTSSKSDLEKAVNGYLDVNKQSNKRYYRIHFTDDMVFVGGIRVIGKEIEATLHFAPTLQDDGNLLLKLRSFHVGALPLPGSALLQYLSQSYTFPEWIVIDPVRKTILADIAAWNENSTRVQVSIVEFDLRQDRLNFDIFLPAEASR